ncbi:hypothetical protein [Streptomyces lavendulae]|uniref:hypothetical protein n=1 Tax=Streptomyces lavendulae TaxID=1914 RepID=UPI0024A4A570|nr:hypothetical protein [Streptomyces lavendulae]GLX19465.1 hypothetical protein Slala01_31090 [Streptomyces lavendulae subsp. lavendulae]GLX26960.1 hypothetical protein Slala02_27800 [Streptomyces lavendulae subsp. lavendulae]
MSTDAAWFLGAAVTALTPVLQWRALPPEGGPTFNSVVPTATQYTDAEDALRRLHQALIAVSTA